MLLIKNPLNKQENPIPQIKKRTMGPLDRGPMEKTNINTV